VAGPRRAELEKAVLGDKFVLWGIQIGQYLYCGEYNKLSRRTTFSLAINVP
jgi:hypothetical protein